MNLSHNRQVYYTIFFFLIANALVLFTARLLPFQDLPNHLAEATVFKLNLQTSDFINEYYQSAPWYFPNTFHPVFCSLFSDIETGNKVFYVLSAVLLLLAMDLIITELNGNRWYGLLSILFLYNYNVTFGFSGFTIAIPTLLFFYYLMLVHARKEKIILKIVASFLLVLIFLMHAQVALLALVLYGLMMLFRYRLNIKALIINSLFIPLPVICMVFLWWSERPGEKEESTLGFLKSYYSTKYFQKIWERLRIIVFDNFQLQDGILGLLLAVLFFSLIFIPLFYYKVLRKKNNQPAISMQELGYPLILLTTALSCYLFLPNYLPGQSPLYERFGTIVNLSFIITGSVLLKHIYSSWLKYFVIIAAIIYCVCWFEYIYAFNKENKAFNVALFDGMQRNERLGGLIYDNKFRGRMLYLHFPSYYLVWKKGLSASMIIDYRFGVVRRTEKGNAIPVYNEWVGNVYEEEPQYDSLLEYQLVRGKAERQPDPNMQNFIPVKQAGKWILCKNKNKITAAR